MADGIGAALGVDCVEELAGGHQSRVFRFARSDGQPAVAKVWDARANDRALIVARVKATAAVARQHHAVCQPLALDGSLVIDFTDPGGGLHLLACFEMALGHQPDPSRPEHATAMGVGLAHLHRAMSRIDTATHMPLTAAPSNGLDLRFPVPNTTPGTDEEPVQLLHGDFHAGNLRLDGGRLRIFDFDDCGHGPPSFDVANALYMVMFDSVTQGRRNTYERFRPTFTSAYEATTGRDLGDEVLDSHIERRIRTLEGWLANPLTAPAGIRSSSPEWQATLRAFVSDASR